MSGEFNSHVVACIVLTAQAPTLTLIQTLHTCILLIIGLLEWFKIINGVDMINFGLKTDDSAILCTASSGGVCGDLAQFGIVYEGFAQNTKAFNMKQR